MPAQAIPVDARLGLVAFTEEVLGHVVSDREHFATLLNIFRRVVDLGLTPDEARKQEGMGRTRFYTLWRRLKGLLTRVGIWDTQARQEASAPDKPEDALSHAKESDK